MYCRAHKTATLTPIQHTVPPLLVHVVVECPLVGIARKEIQEQSGLNEKNVKNQEFSCHY